MSNIETLTYSIIVGLSLKIVYKGPCEVTFRQDEEGKFFRFKPLEGCRGFICDPSTVIGSDENFERLCDEGCFSAKSVQSTQENKNND